MNKFIAFFIIAISIASCKSASKISADATGETARILNILAADEMGGRRPGTPGIEKAANFIAEEFRKAGLQPIAGNSFLQTFTMVRTSAQASNLVIDNQVIDRKNLVVNTSAPRIAISENSGYTVHHITAGNFNTQVQAIRRADKHAIIFVDTAFRSNFARLGASRPAFKTASNFVFVLGNYNPSTFSITAEQKVEEIPYSNVVGILPGKGRAAEQVIFSGHYDHLGIGRPVNGDSIYNGANDDASGVTAVIRLAKQFKEAGNNERTLVFAAFTAEESGGFGAQYFSRQFNPDAVSAMFNIEMIGTESKWGRNSAFITGFERSSMGGILQRNLAGTNFNFHPDPYPEQDLFFRSDNATLARLGVPAHTISTSKMDIEPHYHKPSDEARTLDMANMEQIIQSIFLSARSIVAGTDTPTRVKL